MKHGINCAFAMALLFGISPARGALPQEPDARTAAAVEAADKAWGDAEARGDADFVDWLLLPGYQSVSPAGRATGKDRIVAGARARASDRDAAARTAEWKAAHPVRPEVAIYGNTAVLTWISTKSRTEEPVSSCDIFVYRNGHWHAIYSQHAETG